MNSRSPRIHGDQFCLCYSMAEIIFIEITKTADDCSACTIVDDLFRSIDRGYTMDGRLSLAY